MVDRFTGQLLHPALFIGRLAAEAILGGRGAAAAYRGRMCVAFGSVAGDTPGTAQQAVEMQVLFNAARRRLEVRDGFIVSSLDLPDRAAAGSERTSRLEDERYAKNRAVVRGLVARELAVLSIPPVHATFALSPRTAEHRLSDVMYPCVADTEHPSVAVLGSIVDLTAASFGLLASERSSRGDHDGRDWASILSITAPRSGPRPRVSARA